MLGPVIVPKAWHLLPLASRPLLRSSALVNGILKFGRGAKPQKLRGGSKSPK